MRVCLNVNKLNTKYGKDKKSHNKKSMNDKNKTTSLQLGGNNMWQTVDIPLNYIATNYPIKVLIFAYFKEKLTNFFFYCKFAAIDRDGKYLAIAGMYGFTHFSFSSRKWKLFGNATQEKDMTVTSGLLWWKDFICLGCFNFLDGRNEVMTRIRRDEFSKYFIILKIKFYSRHTNLDNNYASLFKLNSNILKMNIFEDILIVLCSDCHITLFALEKKQNDTSERRARGGG